MSVSVVAPPRNHFIIARSPSRSNDRVGLRFLLGTQSGRPVEWAGADHHACPAFDGSSATATGSTPRLIDYESGSLESLRARHLQLISSTCRKSPTNCASVRFAGRSVALPQFKSLTTAHVQVFGRRHEGAIHALQRPASEKRQGAKSREVWHPAVQRVLWGSYVGGDLDGGRDASRMLPQLSRFGMNVAQEYF
jgi:hypothetical protein